MPLISIVVPCYNEQESLPIFLKELDGVVRIEGGSCMSASMVAT